MLSPKRHLGLLTMVLFLLLILPVSVMSGPEERGEETAKDVRTSRQTTALTRDFNSYINANKLLMFVTNKGSFAFDNSVMLGKADGLYYPYTGVDNILSGANTLSPIYAGSIWIGAVDAATGDTLVTAGQHDTDWGEGPLVDGAPVPGALSDPHYRVYHLYKDSLAGNPNTDYLEWPADEGAPVDELGHPLLRGDQTLWAVYNDLDAAAHSLAQGSEGLGIEVQQTVWASQDEGDLLLPQPSGISVTPVGTNRVDVSVEVVDPMALTGHDYEVTTDSLVGHGMFWRLEDVTLGSILLDYQPNLDGSDSPVTDGFVVRVLGASTTVTSFEVVANADGPIVPPESGAAPWQSFPVPTGVDQDGYPTDGQQVGPAKWLIHTGDDGGSSGGGTRGDYASWILRTFRGDSERLARLGIYDWEIRFTGSNDNPGVGGSIAWPPTAFGLSGQPFWVPFELWRVAHGASLDIRCIPYIFTDGGDSLFWMSSYGSDADATCGPSGCEHSVSGGDNDPYTAWIYWCVPNDVSSSQAGYDAFEAAILADGLNYPFEENEVRVFDRLVLVNWNGHETDGFGELLFDGGTGLPTCNQDLPELGTVFRIVTDKGFVAPRDTVTFAGVTLDPGSTGTEGVSIYAKFKMINKGGMTLNDFHFSVWFDPDLGDASDDFVGCDTLNDIFYCYNADADDRDYGTAVPAVGARIVEGPIVPSPGDVAYVEGIKVLDHKHLGMSSHNRFVNPLGPDDYVDTYEFMNGLTKDGSPLLDHNMQVTKFFGYGDPVAGTGFLDDGPADRRMMANVGPFTFYPNDTQQVIIKIAAGTAVNHLASVNALRNILNTIPDRDFDGTLNDEDNCPYDYNPGQEDANENGIGDACDACCIGKVGDVNGAGGDNPTIGDVSLLIDALFISVDVSMLPCLAEADANLSGTNLNPPLGPEDITIGDLSLLIDLLFITVDLSLLEDCP